MTAGQPSVVIVGVGNEYRSDDGAGIAVARNLRARFPAGITVVEESGEGAALIDLWRSATWVMLVDAVRSGAPPGTIHRLDPLATPIPTGFFHYSTHAFGVAEAVELARSLDQLPPRLILYGIEGENFDAGVGLSSKVEQAVLAVVEKAANELRGVLMLGADG